MEILKFLLIVAIIAFAIVRQARKNKAAQSDKRQPAPVAGHFNPTEELSVKEKKAKLQSKASGQAKKTKSIYGEPAAEGTRTTAPTSTSSETEQATGANFTISSAEEARKAIIWSEILNRKY